MQIRGVFSILMLMGLCGCAGTAQLQQPISDFAAASDTAVTAFQALDATSTANLNAIRAAEVLQKGHVAWTNGDCETGAKGCSLFFRESKNGAALKVHYTSLLPNSLAFVNGIHDYAKALDGLEKADSSADVTAAFSASLSAISTVAGALNLPAGVVTAAVSKPLTDLEGWGFGKYQDSLKMAAFRSATKAADAIIQEALPILNKELQFAGQAQTDALEEDLQTKDEAFSRDPSAANLQAEIQSADALNAALTAKTPSLFAALAAAHGKLTNAIADPTISVTDALTAIGEFAQQAQNVEQIVKQLSATASAAASK